MCLALNAEEVTRKNNPLPESLSKALGRNAFERDALKIFLYLNGKRYTKVSHGAIGVEHNDR